MASQISINAEQINLSIKKYKLSAFYADAKFKQLCTLLKTVSEFTKLFYDLCSLRLFHSVDLLYSLEQSVTHKKPENCLRIEILTLFVVTKSMIHETSYLRQMHHEQFTIKTEDKKHKHARELWLFINDLFQNVCQKFEKLWSTNDKLVMPLPSPCGIYPNTQKPRITKRNNFVTNALIAQLRVCDDKCDEGSEDEEKDEKVEKDESFLQNCIITSKFRTLLEKWKIIMPSTQYFQMVSSMSLKFDSSLWESSNTLAADVSLFDRNKSIQKPCIFNFSSKQVTHSMTLKLNRLYHSKNNYTKQLDKRSLGLSLLYTTFGDYHLPMPAAQFIVFLQTFPPSALILIRPPTEINHLYPREVIVDWSHGISSPIPKESPLTFVYSKMKRPILQFCRIVYYSIVQMMEQQLRIQCTMSDQTFDSIFNVALSAIQDCYGNLVADCDLLCRIDQSPSKNVHQNRYLGVFLNRCIVWVIQSVCLAHFCSKISKSAYHTLLTIDNLQQYNVWQHTFQGPINNEFHRIGMFLYY